MEIKETSFLVSIFEIVSPLKRSHRKKGNDPTHQASHLMSPWWLSLTLYTTRRISLSMGESLNIGLS